jgi:hypothetical protein
LDRKNSVFACVVLVFLSLLAVSSSVGCQTESGTGASRRPRRTLYVAEAANCGGRHPCFATIQEALDAAAGQGDLIKVSQGIYTTTAPQVASIEKSVQLVAGYQADDWSARSANAHPAVIDAEQVPGRRALFIDGTDVATITVRGFQIRGGAAGPPGGGVHVAGGSAVLEENVVEGCTADARGGGLFVEDGSVTLTYNTIRGNVAQYGGGLYVAGGRVVMEGNTFSGNVASPLGGAIAVDGGSVTGVNNLVVDNAQSGAGVYLSGGTLIAKHWTLVNNGRYGVIADLGIDINSGSAMLSKSIVAGHQGGLCGAGAVANQTLFHEVEDPCIAGASCVNNVFGDPKFLNPSAGDYHISRGSAAVDRAYTIDVVRDMDGDSRPVGAASDLGADEIEPERSFLPLILR